MSEEMRPDTNAHDLRGGLCEALAAYIAIGIRHGLIIRTPVHWGIKGATYPSERMLSMSDELAAAVARRERAA